MVAFEERYRQLNADQKRAVDTIEGAVLVVAGPGSGKTEILALRVARILERTDAGPTSVLCLTFTEAAASNMRRRLASLIGTDAYRVQIGTFHGFAQQVAQQYPAFFGNGAELVPAEAVEQRELVAEALRRLPLRDPLRVGHESEELTYLRSAVKRIAELKRAGIGPDTFDAILDHNEALVPLIEAELRCLDATVSMKLLPKVAEAADAIRDLPRGPFPVAAYPDLATAVARSLDGALLDAEAAGKATPVSEWKTRHLPKVTGEDRRALREGRDLSRMRSLALAYRCYQQLLRERGLRDFDDLIVDLIEALRAEPDFRAELQEEYQYVLVDEFQDTNGAQAELVALLADAPVAEGNPNLMVVGDDDQAIYRFQGAGLQHLLGFAERYPQAEVVTMTTNYRSHQAILDLARRHIAAARERLEGRLPGLSKTLLQGGQQDEAVIAALRAGSREHERDAVADLVRRKVEEGVPPGEIAVIGRWNADLEALAPHLAEAGIRVSYERQRNALEDAHVRELVACARAAVAVGQGTDEADPFLPEVLAFAFWGIPRLDLWRASRTAHDQKRALIDIAMESGCEPLKAAAELLVEVGMRARTAPADELLDELAGTCRTPEGRTSPFHAHYFGPEARKDPERLLALVGGLRSILAAFNAATHGEDAMLADFVRFVDLRRDHREPVPTRVPAAEGAVQLVTAHAAKGREFEVVIVLHAATDVWHGAGRRDILVFPENLPIAAAGDAYDDQLRNLYVAVTRAKTQLYLATSPGEKDRSEPLPLLEDLPEIPAPAPRERKEVAWERRTGTITADERAALLPLVADYQITPTQLNDFLDVVHGGPQAFFEKHVLRFPQHQPAHLRFGNAMHAVLERLAIAAHQGSALPDEAGIERLVRTHLEAQRFHGAELDEQLALGTRAIVTFCAQRADELRGATHVEVSFGKDRIVLGDTRLTGKADVIREEEDGLVIVDYKTGRAGEWDDAGKKAARMAQRRQLLFYAILAQQSPRFTGKPVKETKLTFVVPGMDEQIRDLVLEPEQAETDRVARLAQAVYRLVTSLTFPDVAGYPRTAEGIERLEEDVLTGKFL